jgi:hypothetical protein
MALVGINVQSARQYGRRWKSVYFKAWTGLIGIVATLACGWAIWGHVSDLVRG